MDWTSLLGGAGVQDQQAALDQQLQDLMLRRRAAQPARHTTGMGAALGGLGDVLSRAAMNYKEGDLRDQRQALGQKLTEGRQGFLQELMSAQQPVQAPPDSIAAPGYDQASQQQAQQQRLQGLQAGGMLSGDPMIQGYLERAPQMEMQGLNLQKTREEMMAQNSPEAGAATRVLLGKYGVNVPETTPSATLRYLLPTAEKGYAADVAAQAKRDVARFNMGGGGSMLDPAALDQAAELYSTTGQLPQMGMGAAGSALKRQIANRASELHPEASLAGNKAGYHADTTSLGKIQTQTDALNAFERTALANLDQFLQTAHTVVDTGSPLFNAPARSFMQSVAGDPKMAQFNASRQVAVQEISKVLGGSLGGVISDSARHEASGLLTPDASLAQIEAAAQVLRKDMENRRNSMNAEIQGIRQRAGGGQQTTTAAPPSGVPAQAPAGMPHPQDSAAVQWAKSHPNDPRAQRILQINGVQ